MKTTTEDTGFDRGAWLLLIGVIVTTLIVFANTYYTLAQPSEGWQADYNTGQLINFLGDWPTPLQTGDTILAIAEIDLTANTISYKELPAWQTGAIFPYTIERNGVEKIVEVQLHLLTSRQIAQAFTFYFVDNLPQLSWFVAGLVVFLLRPRNVAARLMLVAGASLTIGTRIGWAGTVTAEYFVPRPNFYLDFMFDTQWGWLFFPSFILLLLLFPQPLWPQLKQPVTRRRVIAIGYLVPTVLTLLVAITEIELIAFVVLLGDALLILGLGIRAVIKARGYHNPVARAQVSWIAFGIAFSIGGTLVGYLLDFSGLINFDETPLASTLFNWMTGLALPICIAIAILRYRLFDIDFIIRRTLQYSLLTGALGAVYFGSVVVMQTVVNGVTGRSQPSQLTIVLSTLLIAALFNPLRRRVQTFINRRFYRRHYDAARVLAQFAQTAQNEVDMDRISAVLLNVVEESLKPETVTLWFRKRVL